MTFIHLIINVSTALLLAASSHCMQTPNSPLREEVDLYWRAKLQKFAAYTLDTTFTLPDFSCQLLASPSNLEFGDLTGDTSE